MSRRAAVLVVLLSLAAGCMHQGVRPHRASVTLRVIDESGDPIEGADVHAGFFGSGQGGKGMTDPNGCFRFAGRAVSSLHCEVTKSGYYASGGEVWGGPSAQQMVPPTNAYTVVLKKVIEPVPMLYREVKLTLPSLDTPSGLDLAAGDWVAPHGTGTVSDVWVSGSKNIQGALDYDLLCTLRFNGQDGMIRHRFPGAQRLVMKSDLAPRSERRMRATPTSRPSHSRTTRGGASLRPSIRTITSSSAFAA